LQFDSSFFDEVKLLFGSTAYPASYVLTIMLIVLSLAVYFYAWAYIKGRRFFEGLGNYIYLVALLVPLIAFIIHILSLSVTYLGLGKLNQIIVL